MSWLGSIGGFIFNAWSAVYHLWGTPSEPSSGGLETLQAALGSNVKSSALITGKKGGKSFSATNLTADCFADALQYVGTSFDTAAVALAAAQTNSVIRDRIAPFAYSQHHVLSKFTSKSPDQGKHILTVFAKARPASATIASLCLRETRTEPGAALALVVSRTPLQLTEIDFFKVDMTWETQVFVDALVQCPNLTSVSLSECNITAQVLREIAPTLLRRLPHLKKLDLSNNRFRVEGAVSLASLEFFLDPSVNFSLPQLESLDLGGNSLGSKGVDAILRLGFPGKFTPNLKLLDLRQNALNDDGARTVVRYLAKNMKDNKASPVGKLDVLELSGNGITSEMEPQLRELFFQVKVFVQ